MSTGPVAVAVPTAGLPFPVNGPEPVPARVDQLAPRRSERYVYIDALRGIAALAVVLCHTQFNAMAPWFFSHVPRWGLLQYGGLGVQVFFVLSGFVIVHSLRQVELTFAGLGLFAARRQIRLDPPYWTVLLAGVAIAFVHHALGVRHGATAPTGPDEVPSVSTVLLNLFYLQRMGRSPDLMPVSWTLCIEIQFYVTAALVLWACQKGRESGLPTTAAVWAVCLTGLASAGWRTCSDSQVWFTSYWCYFAAGALACWTIRQRWVAVPFTLLSAGTLVTTAWSDSAMAGVVGVLTAISIVALGLAGRLTTATGGPVLQIAGRISYSLYLVHFPVLTLVEGFGSHHFYGRLWLAGGWMAAGVGSSIVVALLLNRWIESPTMRLAHRLRKLRESKRRPPTMGLGSPLGQPCC